MNITVVHGAQIYGDDPGSGPIAPSEPIVMPGAARPDSECFADMTHTFAGGEIKDEIAAHQRLVRVALTRAREEISAGLPAQAPYDLVCVWLESEGYDTEPRLYRDGYRGCRLETWYWQRGRR
jgi:hypothetical protein